MTHFLMKIEHVGKVIYTKYTKIGWHRNVNKERRVINQLKVKR